MSTYGRYDWRNPRYNKYGSVAAKKAAAEKQRRYDHALKDWRLREEKKMKFKLLVQMRSFRGAQIPDAPLPSLQRRMKVLRKIERRNLFLKKYKKWLVHKKGPRPV